VPHYPNRKNNAPDNFQTPAWALDCLIPYLYLLQRIWEPACGSGNLVTGLRASGFKVRGTDILKGTDFLHCDIQAFDVIVTNPPFSLKDEFLEHCYKLGKPFALLLPISVFDSKFRRKLFNQYGVEFIFPDRRIPFETPNHKKRLKAGKKSSPQFQTVWVTHGLNIGQQLTFTDE
jgi:hypothetical protein